GVLGALPGHVGHRAERRRPVRRTAPRGPAAALRQDVRGRGGVPRPRPRRSRAAPSRARAHSLGHPGVSRSLTVPAAPPRAARGCLTGGNRALSIRAAFAPFGAESEARVEPLTGEEES